MTVQKRPGAGCREELTAKGFKGYFGALGDRNSPYAMMEATRPKILWLEQSVKRTLSTLNEIYLYK